MTSEEIVDIIKIKVEIAKIDDKPIFAEVQLNDNSKKYIQHLIDEHTTDEVKTTAIKFANWITSYENLTQCKHHFEVKTDIEVFEIFKQQNTNRV